jgi:ribosomal protein S18 acetylase RimI-like enzyme
MFIEIKPIPPVGFRQATDRDVDFLYALHVATMKEYVNQTWGWDDAFQESVFRKSYVPAHIQIITSNSKDIGMISLEERTADVFLRAIEIRPEDQGKGIGTTIIQQVINDAVLKLKPVHLQVLKVNPVKGLYERLGFSVIEETKTHFIMKTSLSK